MVDARRDRCHARKGPGGGRGNRAGNTRATTLRHDGRVPLEEMSGFVVGVTADRRAGEQIAMLERRGASVLHGPAIRTHPVTRRRRVRRCDRGSDRPARPTVTVLSTGIGVRGVVEAAEVLGRAEAWSTRSAGSRVSRPRAEGARRGGHRGAAGRRGARLGRVERDPDRAGPRGHRRGAHRRCSSTAPVPQPLADALVELGADVVPIPVYRWSLPDDTGPALRLAQAVADRRVDAVTFTARPQIESLCEIAETEGLLDDLRRGFARGRGRRVRRARVRQGRGRRRLRRSRRAGPPAARLDGDGAWPRRCAARPVRFRLGPDVVHLQGRLVTVAGETVQLSERERDLLAALARRPGVVLSKAELLAMRVAGRRGGRARGRGAVARLRRGSASNGHLLETVSGAATGSPR